MNYIATYFHVDGKGEDSNFCQIAGTSSDKEFQNYYWRCVCVFFHTSLKIEVNKLYFLFFNNENI